MTKRKLKDLYSWDKNPRAIKKDKFEELKKRIQKHGQFKPLIITPEGEVLGGNMRLRAYKDLGIEDVWVSVVEPKNEAEKIEIALADNEEMGYYEPDALAELISQYKDELDLQNYSVHLEAPKSLDDLLSEYSPTEVEEDEAPEVEEGEPDSKVGEVYQLGRHRLMCGDSTKIEDVERLMNGQKADMVFTDPPYGMDLDTDYTKMRPDTEASRKFQKAKGKTTNKNYDRVIGDNEEWVFERANHFDCDEQFWWGGDWYRRTLPVGGSWFVWDKRTNDDGSNLDDMFGSCFELCWSKTRHKREIARIKYASLFGTEREDIKRRLHPTQKPVLLASWFISRFSKDGNNVIDLFGGSGSTLIACEQLDRTCYMMELAESYVDVIIKRWENLTGEKAKLIEPA